MTSFSLPVDIAYLGILDILTALLFIGPLSPIVQNSKVGMPFFYRTIWVAVDVGRWTPLLLYFAVGLYSTLSNTTWPGIGVALGVIAFLITFGGLPQSIFGMGVWKIMRIVEVSGVRLRHRHLVGAFLFLIAGQIGVQFAVNGLLHNADHGS